MIISQGGIRCKENFVLGIQFSLKFYKKGYTKKRQEISRFPDVFLSMKAAA